MQWVASLDLHDLKGKISLIPTRCGRTERVQNVGSGDLDWVLPTYGYKVGPIFLTLKIRIMTHNLWAVTGV